MPEIDLRGNYFSSSAFPREEHLVSRELYQLLAIFSASKELSRRQTSKEGGCVYSWSIRSFEFPEIGRILVSIAAILRNDWDASPWRIEEGLALLKGDKSVGRLVPDLKKRAKGVPLTVRESLNKILHAHTINLERSRGPSIYDGYLKPFVHLYGEKSGKDWKASLDIFRWAEVVHFVH